MRKNGYEAELARNEMKGIRGLSLNNEKISLRIIGLHKCFPALAALIACDAPPKRMDLPWQAAVWLNERVVMVWFSGRHGQTIRPIFMPSDQYGTQAPT